MNLPIPEGFRKEKKKTKTGAAVRVWVGGEN